MSIAGPWGRRPPPFAVGLARGPRIRRPVWSNTRMSGVKGLVGDLVAGSFESCNIDAKLWVELLERIYDELGLGQGERRAAGAEAEDLA